MALPEFDAYAVLGVAPTAEPEATARAYRALAQRARSRTESSETPKRPSSTCSLIRDRR